MKHVMIAFLASLPGLPGLAMTCPFESPAQVFDRAEAAGDGYRVLLGQFHYDPGAYVNGFRDDPSVDPAPVQVAFHGRILTPLGFTRSAEYPVTLQQVCVGTACGAFYAERQIMAFAQTNESGMTIIINPCQEGIFVDPTEAQIQEVIACAATGCRNEKRCAKDRDRQCVQ